ncbi:unnamed protein product [Pelagomonas calceolata]|uniref:Uncharacterized protein n=1 Tax=Pelagomonas calceolata TaxID=35677 RepID=A0A8J2SRC1_9STRA|nr:unnamed protein product [Pelagomonas calceolata]
MAWRCRSALVAAISPRRRSEPGSTRPPRAKRDRPRVQNPDGHTVHLSTHKKYDGKGPRKTPNTRLHAAHTEVCERAVPGGVLNNGDRVEYRVAVFNERPRAKDVRVLKRA